MYAGSKVVVRQSQYDSSPSEARLRVDTVVTGVVLRFTKKMFKFVIAVYPPTKGTTVLIVVSAFKVTVYDWFGSEANVVAPVV